MTGHTLFQEYHLEIEEDLCFVLMPFAEEFQPIYDDHIKPAVEGAGLRCVRADDLFGPQAIIYDIWQYICRARVVVAELTGRNPNVFYEVGLSHALDKKVILLTQSMDDVPFDLRHLRCIVYEYTPRGAEALGRKLCGAIVAVLKESVAKVPMGREKRQEKAAVEEQAEELRREKESYQREMKELRQRLRERELEDRRPAPTLGIGSTRINLIDGAEMVYVPAGEFIMGSENDNPDAWDNEKPQHTVYLDGFWMYKTPVTNAQYRQGVEAGACDLPHNTKYYNDPAYNDHPVVCVDWYQARAYCEWAGGRLPTETEWEKAARGTDGRQYPWGNEFDKTKCNTKESDLGDTTLVDQYPAGASPCGALDMAGNVWEWTSSLYKDYPYRADDGREDVKAGGLRVLRGGSFCNSQRSARSVCRYWCYRYRDVSCGFRVVGGVPLSL